MKKLTVKNKSALFLKTKNIGDSIILAAAISALPQDYRFVDVICLPHSEAIFKMHKRVRHVLVVPRNQKGIKKMRAYFHLFSILLANHYDLLAHFSIDWRGALLARLLNFDIKVARNTKRRGLFWHKSFTFLAPELDDDRAMAEQDVDLLRAAGLYGKKMAPAYTLNTQLSQDRKLAQWLNQKGIASKSKLIVIHASSRWKFKEIPIATWATIIDRLTSEGFDIILSGSKDDSHTNEMILNACKTKLILTENFSLYDTASLYKLSNLVITIDSMSTHLASALQCPVLAIFGPTYEKNWGPWRVKNKVIALSEKDSPTFLCRPCGRPGCEDSRVSQCLVQMDPQKIIRGVYSLLK